MEHLLLIRQSTYVYVHIKYYQSHYTTYVLILLHDVERLHFFKALVQVKA